MKTMSCNQLGGACEMKFHTRTFEEIKELSMKHGVEMFQKNDHSHLKAMEKMQELMKSPKDMHAWLESKKSEFETLPNNI